MSKRHVDVLIAGAGIAGLLLARELQTRGRRVAIAQDAARPSAGAAAVGLLNPVRGRRYTLAWRAAEVFADAITVYEMLGAESGCVLFRPLPVLRMFASAEERAVWEKRAACVSDAGFRHHELRHRPTGWRTFGFGAISVSGGGVVDPRSVTETLRQQQRLRGDLIEIPFSADALKLGDLESVAWTAGDLVADHVVLAGGAADLSFLRRHEIELRPVKGEALLVRAPGLDTSAAYIEGHHLVPVGADLWVCGGTKVPGDATWGCTEAGRAELADFMRTHVDAPWEVVEHWCGVRATTLDTRPVAGPLDGGLRVSVLNGLGSQGFVVAPWLARRLAEFICDHRPLPSEVLPSRLAPARALSSQIHWRAADIAREITLEHLAPGDLAVDLTAGNGGDALWLAKAVGPEGAVVAIDIQEAALESARRRIEHERTEARITLVCGDHARLTEYLPASWHGRLGAVVATLGLLPGGTSAVATQGPTTVRAFAQAVNALRHGGVLTAVLSTTHPGGADELGAVERWASQLDPARYTLTWLRDRHGPKHAPCVLSVVHATK